METWVSYAGILRFGFEPLGDFMEWTAPVFEEVCLNCEINSYASAKL
jgi:coenzyme PQQ precursor peptide PqqA